MNDDQLLLYTIAEILLEVELSTQHKERLSDALCGIYNIKIGLSKHGDEQQQNIFKTETIQKDQRI